jgi:hypothetical protein
VAGVVVGVAGVVDVDAKYGSNELDGYLEVSHFLLLPKFRFFLRYFLSLPDFVAGAFAGFLYLASIASIILALFATSSAQPAVAFLNLLPNLSMLRF